MKLQIIDKSLYFKGLLLLIGKDKIISNEERNYILKIGKVLGFEKEFCKNAIDELLENPYIEDEPPVFSKRIIAESFIKDGLKTAIVDRDIDPIELEWLKIVAYENKIEESWFLQSLQEIVKDHPNCLAENKLNVLGLIK
ncbi:MAG: hypothetical protein JW866_05555 [Ignavibacteriales bacterium]|nr:hypothetical protein [Ignavibacteriales bacterium]